MKKEILLVLVLAIIIVIIGAILVFVSAKPPANQPTPTPLPTGMAGLEVFSPKPNDSIFLPLKITGRVSGSGWAGFEGQVGTVRLLDYKGNQLGEAAILKATTEWTKIPTSFEANLNYSADQDGEGTLVFKNENPSGLPANGKTFTMPVKYKKTDTTTVKVYFGKNEITGSTCSVVFPVDRIIPKTQAVAQAAISELLKGPTPAEKEQGYFSSIPAGSQLNSIKIENGTASVDFNQTTESGGGSCSMVERVSQINFTLKQFPTVKAVKLSIDGRTGDIFQP